MPDIPGDCLNPGGVTYDMMYSDAPTAFVRWGLAHGASRALDGLGMLVEQGPPSGPESGDSVAALAILGFLALGMWAAQDLLFPPRAVSVVPAWTCGVPSRIKETDW